MASTTIRNLEDPLKARLRVRAAHYGRSMEEEARHIAFAPIAAGRRQKGRPTGAFDVQIAAIASSRGAALATRNVADFLDCGLPVISPWES